MKPYLLLRATDLAAQRPTACSEDVYFKEALASSVIKDTMAAGAVVLDPFTGYGTTLVAAERLGRVVHGDARRLCELVEVRSISCSPPAVHDNRRPPREPAHRLHHRGRRLRHVPSGDRCRLAEVARLLRPGGDQCGWDRHPPGHAGDYVLWFARACVGLRSAPCAGQAA